MIKIGHNSFIQHSFLRFPIRQLSFTYPCPRRLREIVKMSAFEREKPETIDYIWTEYHKLRGHTVSAVMTPTLYVQLLTRAKAHPFFVFPVPKAEDDSYFMLLAQSQEKSIIFTWLEDFKKNPASANPYLVLTIFDELVRLKHRALMRGDIVSHMSQEEGNIVMT